jgi:hypothetical protein
MGKKNSAQVYSHISIYVKANMFISLPAKRHKKIGLILLRPNFFINVLMKERATQGRPYR